MMENIEIEENAFEDTGLETIIFTGTTEQWNLINKNVNWNVGVDATKVICSNGEVSL